MSHPHKSFLEISSLHIQRSPHFSLDVPLLKIEKGIRLAVIGSNGSGKTTFLESLVGLIHIREGHITLEGSSFDLGSLKSKRLIGYIPDDDQWIIPELTAQEYFQLLLSLIPSTDRLASQNWLSTIMKTLDFHQESQLLGSLSHGNRKKVQLIAGLFYKPQFLVIDELRNGLDPLAIKLAESLLEQLAAEDTTVIASTHDLYWAERFADYILILENGKVCSYSSLADIRRLSATLEDYFLNLQDRGGHE